MVAKYLLAAAPIALIVAPAPAFAGEEVAYAAAPSWVVPADIDAAMKNRQELVLADRQVMLKDGVVQRYVDMAYDLRSSEILGRLGTLQFAWMPDKGDLIVHRLELRRGKEVIDLLAQGVKPEVIRRESELERRSIDGMLTAVVKVPGARVGDVLRFTVSTTLKDQALREEMQAIEGYMAEPAKVGFGRLRMSWPADSDVNFSSIGDAEVAELPVRNGIRTVEVMLPIAKQDEIPQDAPGRYRMAPMLAAGSFASWAEVAAVMAPHYATEGTIAPGSALAKEVARISGAARTPLERAALALQSVQDEINYLANGMNGGNYLPQSPADTWSLRYGDCKAKTLLLLAMLHDMGIEARPVLVNTDNGDAVSRWQPLPGAFDHVIVHARIDGKDYWLDGTGSGGRLANIDEVPDFAYALPLIAQDAQLVKLEQRWPASADRVMKLRYDYSRGVDLPGLVDFEVETRGQMASWMEARAAESDTRTQLSHAQNYFKDFIDAIFYEGTFTYDEVAGVGRLNARGIVFEPFQLERNTANLDIDTASTNWSFDPDRSRAAWRDIPYMPGGPMTTRYEVTYVLPEGDGVIEMRGEPDLAEQVVASTRLSREAQLAGRTLTVRDMASYVPIEVPAREIAAQKAAMRSLVSKDPEIRITDPRRSWELSDAEIRQRVSTLIPPVTTLVDLMKDEPQMPAFRAAFRMSMRDYEGALADVDRTLASAATAEGHLLRSNILSSMGRFGDAAEASAKAYDLDGSLDTASAHAMTLAYAGRHEEALAVLDDLDLSGDEASQVAMTFAEIAGSTARKDEAWQKLVAATEDRPSDKSLLNSQCWFMATWSYRLDEGAELCDKAVRVGDYDAPVLDSRAMLYHRLGRDEEALKDIDAVLRKQPGMAASLYLRGVILSKRGDRAAAARDIEHALRIEPAIAERYRAYGLVPAR